jgi:hypothetical protein
MVNIVLWHAITNAWSDRNSLAMGFHPSDNN